MTTAFYRTGFIFPRIVNIRHIFRGATPPNSQPPSTAPGFFTITGHRAYTFDIHWKSIPRADALPSIPGQLIPMASPHPGTMKPDRAFVGRHNTVELRNSFRPDTPWPLRGHLSQEGKAETLIFPLMRGGGEGRSVSARNEILNSTVLRGGALSSAFSHTAFTFPGITNVNHISRESEPRADGLQPSTTAPISITSITSKTGYPSTRIHEILFHLVTARRLIRSSFEPEQTSSPHLFFPVKPAPDFHYFNPLKGAAGVSNQMPARVDKSLEELAGLKEKPAHGRESHTYDSIRIDQKMNVDLGQLTDRVYRMLELKIKVEKERRGL